MSYSNGSIQKSLLVDLSGNPYVVSGGGGGGGGSTDVGIVGLQTGLSPGDDAKLSVDLCGAIISVPRCVDVTPIDNVIPPFSFPLSCTGNFVLTPTLLYAFDGTNYDRVPGDINGLSVKNNKATSTLANNATLAAGADSAITIGARTGLLLYEDSNTGISDKVIIEVQRSAGHWFIVDEIQPLDTGVKRWFSTSITSVNFALRIRNPSAGDYLNVRCEFHGYY